VTEPARARTVDLALAAVAMGAALPVAWPPAVAIPALGLSLAVTPGVIAARALWPSAGAAGRALFALATSPFLTGALAALLLALGVPPAATARGVLAAVALVALAAALKPAGPVAREREGVAPWLAAAVWTALVAALLLGNPWLLRRSDAWFHAAVTLQMALRPLPPEDPYFAGLRLLYFWGYHAWALLWPAAAPRATVWAPLVLLNLTGALAVVLGVCLLARRLGAGTRGMAVAAVVATLGYAPFSWLWIGVRSMTGEVTGLDEIRRLVTTGAAPANDILATWTLHSSMAFFGDKFLVLTPFALGLAQFTLVLLALLDFIARPRGREGAALGLAVAAALFIHSVVGWSAALVAGTWWWWALWRSRRPEDRPLRAVLLPLIAVFAAVVLILSPYLAATTVGKHQAMARGFSPLAFGSWLLGGLLLVPAGMTWLWRERHRRPAALHLLVFAVALTVAGLSLRLPDQNQSKFFNLLFLLLAAPAGLALVAWHERSPAAARPWITSALVLAIAPTALVALWGFASERGQGAQGWERPVAGERDAIRWAASHTPPDAMFVDRKFWLDLPSGTGRSMISGGERWEDNWGYAPAALAARRRIVADLGSLGPASDEARRVLSELGRPVFVTLRRRWGDTPDWDHALAGPHPGYRLVYRNADIALFRWEAAP
jgi:hypothetical protein